jgi:RNase adapter protein RapZ
MSPSALHLIIISGMSGSGKSTAARALEDAGFFVVDNLPLVLLNDFLRLNERKPGNNKFAVVVDVRNRAYLKVFPDVLKDIQDAGHRVDIFFFDAADEVLVRRFSETRRRHPLLSPGGIPDAIEQERELLRELESMATLIFDSSRLSVHELRSKVFQCITNEKEIRIPMSVHLQSFGFRYGIPIETDMVLDVRFMVNPYFVEDLRPLSGLESPVKEFVASQTGYHKFFEFLIPLLEFLLPEYQKENKSYFTISIGCTGGRHRSVAVVEDLFARLAERKMITEVIHRDVNRGYRQ